MITDGTDLSECGVTARANRIAVKHRLGKVVAIIEIVSPGNKSSKHHLRTFVEKTRELLDNGINLLIVDLFPPSERDPQGIHKASWDEIREEPFELPPDKPLTLAAYAAGPIRTASVEPVAVGDILPELPIILEDERYCGRQTAQTATTRSSSLTSKATANGSTNMTRELSARDSLKVNGSLARTPSIVLAAAVSWSRSGALRYSVVNCSSAPGR
jgi:hypothetical protein